MLQEIYGKFKAMLMFMGCKAHVTPGGLIFTRTSAHVTPGELIYMGANAHVTP